MTFLSQSHNKCLWRDPKNFRMVMGTEDNTGTARVSLSAKDLQFRSQVSEEVTGTFKARKRYFRLWHIWIGV